MCLLYCAYQIHPEYPLIVAANRDEFYARPSRPLDFHADYPDVLMGRDVEAGGTWAGLAMSGRFAALTNLAGAFEPADAKSRGELPIGWLTGSDAVMDYGHRVGAAGEHYKGFNLLVCDLEQLCFVSNASPKPRELPPGIYGLANNGLDDDSPRVASGKARISDLIGADELDQDEFFAVLLDAGIAAAGYGTRASSLLTVNKAGRYSFTERSWPVGGASNVQRQFEGFLAI